MSVSVQEAPFDAGAEIAAVAEEAGDAGAVVSFSGIVRRGEAGVLSLTLEHFPGMTERKLAEIEREAHERWPLLASRIVHRVGTLEAGEPIVLAVTASAHRQAAFEAAAFLMDYLKTRAPFWKRERTAEGASWVEARESDDAAASRWSEAGRPERGGERG